MAEITEHDSKQEREGDKNRNGRVDLLVRGGTISIDDGLETFGDLVGLKVSRRRLVGLNLIDNRRDGEASSVSNILKGRPDQGKIIGRYPGFGNESSPS